MLTPTKHDPMTIAAIHGGFELTALNLHGDKPLALRVMRDTRYGWAYLVHDVIADGTADVLYYAPNLEAALAYCAQMFDRINEGDC